MATILAEAGVRVTAITDDLRRSLRRDLNSAMRDVKIDTTPLQDLERSARRTNLELIKARDAVRESTREVGEAEQALADLRANSEAKAEDIAAAERRLTRVRAEAAVAVDRVSAAEQKLNSQQQERIRLLRSLHSEERTETETREVSARATLNLGRALSVLPSPFDAARRGSTIFGTSLKFMTAASVASLGALGAVAGAGGLAGVAAAAAQAAGAVALLPAVWGFAAAGMAALTVGLQGVGDALKNLDEPAKLAEALKELSPAAREFIIAIKELSPAARELRLAVQEQLFTELADNLRDLAEIYLPILEGGLSGIARSISHAGQGFATFARESRTVVDLTVFLRNAQRAAAQLASATRPILEGLRDIGTVGSEFLPSLASGFQDAAQRFADFIRNARQTGELKQFIADALANLKQFLQVLRNIGGIIGGVFRAGEEAGAGLLTILEEITGSMRDFIDSTAGQTALSSFFVSAREAARALAPILEQVALLIGNDLAPILADIAEAVGPSVVVILKGLGEALRAASPGIKAFAEGFARFLEGVAPALGPLGELAGVIGEALGDAFAELGPVIGEVATILAGELKSVLPELVPALVDLAKAAADLFVAASPLIRPLTQLAVVILTAFADVAKELAPVLAEISVGLAEALAPVLPDLARAMADFAKEIAPIAGPLGKALVDVLRAVLPVLPPLIQFMRILLIPLQLVAQAVSGLITLGAGLIKFITETIGAIGKFGASVTEFGVDILNTVHDTGIGVEKVAGQAVASSDHMAIGVKNGSDRARFALNALKSGNEEVFRALQVQRAADISSANRWANAMFGSLFKSEKDTDKSLSNIARLFRGLPPVAGQSGAATGRSWAAGLAAGDAASRVRAAILVAGVRDVLGKGVGDAARAGARTAQSYADGLANQAAIAAAVRNAARLAAAVAAFFPSSPAKRGPFSGRGWTPYRGAALVRGFAEGMLQELQLLTSAAGLTMDAAASGLTPGRIVPLDLRRPDSILPQYRGMSEEQILRAIEAGVTVGFSRARVVISAREMASAVKTVSRDDRSRG